MAAARAGKKVVLLERGPFPGSKNVYGGVVYARILDNVIPRWWERVPVQRWVVRRSTMAVTSDQALSIDFRTERWGQAPYNGMTTFRADFDSWLASEAVASGVELVCSTVATGLRWDRAGRICGVRTDRPDGDLAAPVVIACDGVNSFLAKEAGLLPRTEPDHLTLGVKEVLSLPADVIEERFNVGPMQGVDIELVGCTGGIPGGGFVYTNRDTLSVGVVVSITALAASGIRPEELIADLKAHPAIAGYVRGAAVKEYSAHLIPEGGFDHMPPLVADGLMLAGDAAAMTLAAGLWLEGVNFAIGSGLAAGGVAAAALEAGDVSREGLAGYRRELEGNFVLADHRRYRGAADLIMSERLQQDFPQLACDMVEAAFTVTNPQPKPGFTKIVRRAMSANGLKARHVAWDALRSVRVFR
jgi:electron transfer flavoprotein-quinone oxidoreductase